MASTDSHRSVYILTATLRVYPLAALPPGETAVAICHEGDAAWNRADLPRTTRAKGRARTTATKGGS